MNTVLSCDNVWKSYSSRRLLGLKSVLLRKDTAQDSQFSRRWALEDVSLSVEAGTAFGVVGANGTGKSTLLSLLLGTILPDHGTVAVNGRIGSFLELGGGFHYELSGRENVYLFGSILGMRLQEVSERIEEIIEFSELGGAIENPVRVYSAGMIARLAFSVIVHAPADILLIDEVLAVGDSRFQERCMSRLLEFKQNRGTLIIVSHNMAILEKICEHGLCLDGGKVTRSGAMRDVTQHYREIIAGAGTLGPTVNQVKS